LEQHTILTGKIYSQKSKCSQKAIAGKLKIDLATAKDITAGLGYRKGVCSMGAMSAYVRNEDSKTGSILVTTCSLQK
jgi:hypothetical protein